MLFDCITKITLELSLTIMLVSALPVWQFWCHFYAIFFKTSLHQKFRLAQSTEFDLSFFDTFDDTWHLLYFPGTIPSSQRN